MVTITEIEADSPNKVSGNQTKFNIISSGIKKHIWKHKIRTPKHHTYLISQFLNKEEEL